MELLIKVIITGIITGVVIISLISAIINTGLFENIAPWIALIVSISTGIIITIIVDERAKRAHQEVITSQEEIAILIRKLEETDRKHNEALELLRKSRKHNEDLSSTSLISTLEYVVDMLDKLFKVIKIDKINVDDQKLVEKLLSHLESPLNILTQALPQTGTRFQNQKDELSDSINTLRKLVIASLVVSDTELKRTVSALKKNKDKLEDVLKKIKDQK